MPKITGAEAVIQTLEAEGINTFFGVPGGENLPLFDAVHEHTGMRPIVTRHEQGAAFMADGYARASRKSGVAVTISGNGFMNAMTPLAQAKASSSPVIHLTGSNPQAFVDQVSAFSYQVKQAKEIPSVIRDAMLRMVTVRPGPVVLSISHLFGQVDDLEVKESEEFQGKEGDAKKIAEAAKFLVQAERPFIYLGERVVRLQASEELIRLAELLQAPYFTTRQGKGAVRENHPLYLGAGWDAPIAGEVSDKLMNSIDVALCVEAPAALGGAFSGEVIRIGVDEREMVQDKSSKITIAGHTKKVMKQLCDEVESLGGRKSEFPEELIAAFKKESLERDMQIAPLALETLKLLRSALPPDTIVTSDSLIGLWGCRWYEILEPNTFHFPNGTLGFGMPAAVGAKLACPDKPVVAIAGDGAFMYTASDLATAVQHNVNIKIVICNSHGFEAIRHHQIRRFGRAIAYEHTSPPDFAVLAEAFGAEGVKIDSHEKLPQALEKVLETDRVSVIDMPLAIPPM
ncbi:thiamine pyrophosphate-binding protein [bacterium]|nr:thiamine pyrophosphate-binding protein [bacterium]